VTGWAIVCFLLAALCVLGAIRPQATWRFFEGWQFKNPDDIELSDAAVLASVVSGLVGAAVLTGIGVWLIATEDQRACEQILVQLETAAAGVDFDTSNLQEISDDFDARWDLDRTAAQLDVELVERGSALEVVDEDGNLLGTIDEDGAHHNC
jgi:hypothetical protein